MTVNRHVGVAITLATHESNQQPILFTTRFGYQGKYSEEDECTVLNEWTIKAVETDLERNWSFATFRVHLTCNLTDSSMLPPPLPKVDRFRGGQYPFLTVEDEIRIYAGYVDSPNTPIDANILAEVELDENDNPIFPKGKLMPIFWGFIDKVDFVAGMHGKGCEVILSGRDRTRITTDTVFLTTGVIQDSYNLIVKDSERRSGNGVITEWDTLATIGLQATNGISALFSTIDNLERLQGKIVLTRSWLRSFSEASKDLILEKVPDIEPISFLNIL